MKLVSLIILLRSHSIKRFESRFQCLRHYVFRLDKISCAANNFYRFYLFYKFENSIFETTRNELDAIYYWANIHCSYAFSCVTLTVFFENSVHNAKHKHETRFCHVTIHLLSLLSQHIVIDPKHKYLGILIYLNINLLKFYHHQNNSYYDYFKRSYCVQD